MNDNLLKEQNKAYKDLLLDFALLVVVIVLGIIALKTTEFLSVVFIILLVVLLILLTGCITMIICDNQIINDIDLRLKGLKNSEEEENSNG
jgi:hypothetical protein